MTHTPHAAGGLHEIIDTGNLREGIRVIQDASLRARLLTLCNGYDALKGEHDDHLRTIEHSTRYIEQLRGHLLGIKQHTDQWDDEELNT